MTWAAVAAFLAVDVLLVLTLGADWAYAIAAGVGGRPVLPAVAGRSPWRGFARGAGVSGLNPKGLLLYIALLPQFAHPGPGWPIAAQIGLLGVLHMSDCAVVYSGVAFLARLLLRTRAAAARTLTRISGAVMIAVAAALLIERLATLSPPYRAAGPLTVRDHGNVAVLAATSP